MQGTSVRRLASGESLELISARPTFTSIPTDQTTVNLSNSTFGAAGSRVTSELPQYVTIRAMGQLMGLRNSFESFSTYELPVLTAAPEIEYVQTTVFGECRLSEDAGVYEYRTASSSGGSSQRRSGLSAFQPHVKSGVSAYRTDRREGTSYTQSSNVSQGCSEMHETSATVCYSASAVPCSFSFSPFLGSEVICTSGSLGSTIYGGGVYDGEVVSGNGSTSLVGDYGQGKSTVRVADARALGFRMSMKAVDRVPIRIGGNGAVGDDGSYVRNPVYIVSVDLEKNQLKIDTDEGQVCKWVRLYCVVDRLVCVFD